ncbi:MAG: FkbM family methyltransferase [Candidatus Nanopelagicales bacterium]|nr:FkbM family methyltransferase [Candidatus Nanopelagicales bacterium]MDZ4248973.1 FkbM family methyltransferase [Candidatus Nanopelagicales bacterium]
MDLSRVAQRKLAGVRWRLLRALSNRAISRPHDTRLVRFGSDYGGWWIPDTLLHEDSVVYSAGVGEDTTFDEAIVKRFGCVVHAFDPTPRAVQHASTITDPRFVMHPVGIWKSDTTLKLFAPANRSFVSHSYDDRDGTGVAIEARCQTLSSIMAELGHDHIDLLKMDIEGAEAPVIDDLLEDRRVRPRCIAVEMEAREPVLESRRRISRLIGAGYSLLHVEDRCYVFLKTA